MRSLYLTALFLCVLSLYASVKAQVGESSPDVTTKYDKSKDSTTIEFQQLEISHSAEREILLSVSFDFEGQQLKKRPDDVIFVVSIISPGGYKYPDVMKPVLKIDGKDASEFVMLNLDKRPLQEKFLETIGTRMRYDLFEKLSKGSVAEFQLDNTRVQLSAGHITKIAELLKKMNP